MIYAAARFGEQRGADRAPGLGAAARVHGDAGRQGGRRDAPGVVLLRRRERAQGKKKQKNERLALFV